MNPQIKMEEWILVSKKQKNTPFQTTQSTQIKEIEEKITIKKDGQTRTY